MNRYLWSASLSNFLLKFTNFISFCYIRFEFSHNLGNFIILRDAVCFIPNPLMGGVTVYSSSFFCSENFGRWMSSQRNVSVIIEKLVQHRIQNLKDFFEFRFFSRSYRGLKFCVNTWYLAWFCCKLSSNKIFIIKILIQNYISRHKMNQFWVSKRRMAIKTTNFDLMVKFTWKKSNFFDCFIRKYFVYFLFFKPPRVLLLFISRFR